MLIIQERMKTKMRNNQSETEQPPKMKQEVIK